MNEIKTVKMTEKGQICIPKDVRNEMNLIEGETLLMIVDDDKIILEKTSNIKKKLKLPEGIKNMIMSEQSLKKDWDNKYDERWDKY
ncbi:MAG: AbrB/MazE/SpoVT family DNA-binding domain-containing protein [Candidatus Aenigmarchaeota archaeon]|nr:AbrB/MazE/SpoVT family DNA-binding domain-containing protein [Candidatus Aenigmarchaeota archaeon]